MPGWYDTALICKNGHVINWDMKASPKENVDFCQQCGGKTISSCGKCGEPIRGRYNDDDPDVYPDLTSGKPIPNFCHKCGAPYPWIEEKVEAAREFADLLEELSDSQREELKKSLDDIVRDTPRTIVAATRFKRIVGGLGTSAMHSFREILVNVISETAKKVIYGP